MTKQVKHSTKASKTEKKVSLTRKLQKPAAILSATLSSDEPEKVLASSFASNNAKTAPREALAALYDLAIKMHSSRLPYHAPRLITSEKEHITLEQIWGQMNVLLRPVLRRLQDNVRKSQRILGADTFTSDKKAKKHKNVKSELEEAVEAEDDATDDDNPVIDNTKDNQKELHSSLPSDSDMDEEIAELLAKSEKHKRSSKGAKISATKDKNDKSGNDWRYAFGKANDEEEQWGEEADDIRNMDDADKEDIDHDHSDDAPLNDKEEELEALRELYGEDFVDDGQGFIGEGDDPDMEEDIELDDPAHEFNPEYDGNYLHDCYHDDQGDNGDVASGAPVQREQQQQQQQLFQPHDARFYGSDNILEEDYDYNSVGDTDKHNINIMDSANGVSDIHDHNNNNNNNYTNNVELMVDNDPELQEALANPNLTELERQRLREQKMIEILEQRRLYGADWAMAGESAANKRPREALLEVHDLEFEHGMKAVPVITPAITAQLEERIKRRVLENHYDDVSRKTAMSSANDLVTTRTDAALESQKSKMSLMDLYEKEYLEKARLAAEQSGMDSTATSAEPLTEIEKDELRAVQMWKRLAQHLDALSNFYFTPKPAQQDLEARVRAVESQAPALVLESVGNFAASRADALAPQDLYRASSRRFADVGSAEMLPRERRALRRSKKEHGEKVKGIVESRKKALQQKAKAKANQRDGASDSIHNNHKSSGHIDKKALGKAGVDSKDSLVAVQ